MKESALKTKSKTFALRIIKMHNYLCGQNNISASKRIFIDQFLFAVKTYF